uniref:Costars domain-containing protein n=1 Tax=Octopus bimaculoides TaxID=37653 RepID=A0A0L8H0H2_OCTBM|eukprot:XP_014776450.1 PREDICTED: actin-binding Rho-activating protein-like [Octopus bimaculoides]
MPFSKNLVSEISTWQARVDDHKEKQLINPFSLWEGASHREKLSKTDENYGKPVEGTLTAIRGQEALESVYNEIHELCMIIAAIGVHQTDKSVRVTFGELFHAYLRISNKLVGMLIRARRHNLLDFEGEILYQCQDEKVEITLFKVPER